MLDLAIHISYEPHQPGSLCQKLNSYSSGADIWSLASFSCRLIRYMRANAYLCSAYVFMQVLLSDFFCILGLSCKCILYGLSPLVFGCSMFCPDISNCVI